MKTSNIIIGCGDVGKRIARLILNQGNQVYALSHREASQKDLHKLGIHTISANLDDLDSLTVANFQSNNIFYLAPPPNEGVSDLRMQNFLTALSSQAPPRKIILISTTGVYGDANGEWISEEQTPTPKADRAIRRLDAEQQLLNYCTQSGCEYNILRVSGIYCLNKLPIERLKTGVVALNLAIAPSSNRIHADDLAKLCLLAMEHKVCNQIFNAADGNPTSITDYFIQVAKVFDLPPPTQISRQEAQTQISAAMLSYLAESKKISNKKILDTFDITLQFPNLKTGLQQCLNEFNQRN